jgi:DNA-binding ferritin-like protein (Dps family)
MTTTIAEFTTKVIGDKRRWRAYKARTRQLPEPYRKAIKALERYLLRFGPADADQAATAFEDLATRFEQAAAAGTPVREIVGENPVDFAKGYVRQHTASGLSDQERERLISEITGDHPEVFDAFLQDYAKGSWVAREQQRLTKAVDRADAPAGR